MNRSQVFEAIDDERMYQQAKYGVEIKGRMEDQFRELASDILLGEKYFELAKMEFQDGNRAAALENLRKLTAIGVRCLEQHGAPPRKLTGTTIQNVHTGRQYRVSGPMHRWIVTILAGQRQEGGYQTETRTFVTNAFDRNDAIVVAQEAAHIVFPSSKGWLSHGWSVQRHDAIPINTINELLDNERQIQAQKPEHPLPVRAAGVDAKPSRNGAPHARNEAPATQRPCCGEEGCERGEERGRRTSP